MIKEIKNGIVTAIMTFFITIVLQYLVVYFFADDGKMQLTCNKINDNNYQTIIAIKNMSSDEYLKNVEIKFKDNIEIIAVEQDGKLTGNNENIVLKKLTPKAVSIIKINSKQSITDNDIIIIKNGSNITLSIFNDESNYKLIYLILVVTYAIINFAIGLYFDYKNYEHYNNAKKSTEAENEKLNIKCNDAIKRMNKIEDKLEKTEKESLIEHTIYLKELNQLEKENNFLKDILLKNIDNKITKEELEKLLIENMKRISKDKISYLTYDDVYNMLEAKYEKRKKVVE